MPATFRDFPKNELDKYKTAFNNAKYYLGKARNELKNIWENRTKVMTPFEAARSRFTTFWGPLTQNRAADLTRNYQLLMSAMMEDMTISYDGAEMDAKAYVLVADCAAAPGQPFTAQIYFCPELLENYAAIGTNSAMGTIIHELSHLVLGTDDHIYGMRSCTELIAQNKITNADNYKYFSELFQYQPGTEPALKDGVDLHKPPVRV